jgi:hypothetical protein
MLTPGNELAELKAIRAAAVKAGYITLDEPSADAWIEALNLPDSVQIIVLTSYATWAAPAPVQAPMDDDAAAIEAELAVLRAKLAAVRIA